MLKCEGAKLLPSLDKNSYGCIGLYLTRFVSLFRIYPFSFFSVLSFIGYACKVREVELMFTMQHSQCSCCRRSVCMLQHAYCEHVHRCSLLSILYCKKLVGIAHEVKVSELAFIDGAAFLKHMANYGL